MELGAGAKLMVTSGGYRTVSSRATVARLRKHVSPLTGVVTRLERIEAENLPMNTNFFARATTSPAGHDKRAQIRTDRRQLRQRLAAEQAEAAR